MTDFHIGKDIRLDTSDTHTYGEILIHSEKGEVCTVHPIDGDEDEPNFPACHLITAAPDLYVELWNTVQLLTDIVEGRDWGAIEEYICSAQTALAKARGE